MALTVQTKVTTAQPAPWLSCFGQLLDVMIVVLPVCFAVGLHQRLGLSIYDAQLLAAVLGLALARCLLSWPLDHDVPLWLRLIGMIAAPVTLAGAVYVAIDYPAISLEVPFLPGWLVALSTILFAALMLTLRSAAGTGIVIVVLAFLIYGLFGHLLPGELRSRPTSAAELVTYLAIDANGMLGSALKVGVQIVVPYLLFGQLLSRSGAADFFNDLALSAMGRFRGGPAKVAIAASGLFGSISGSAVGNVVGTGVVTIPMMLKSGFDRRYAAAVEAVASTGGQLVPPVMGASVFIMADFIGVDYTAIMLAALPSAALYYLAVFINVDLNAGKAGISGLPRENLPRALTTLIRGWHFFIPFTVLFYGLFALNMRPERAAIWATVALMILSVAFGYAGKRPTLRMFWEVIADAGRAATGLIIVCAAAGIIIGVLNLSGLAFNLTLHIITASGNSIVVLAVITALISIVLGMGMPTVGVYILLATLVAPALVEAGVPLIPAHLFVLYFGLLSMVTPPVALASFAAANIAKASPWACSIASMKLAWPAYIVPFLFLFSPALTMQGSWSMIFAVLATSVIGIYMITAAIVGFMSTKLAPFARLLTGIGGALSLVPAGMFEYGPFTDLIGVLILPLVYLYQLRLKRRLP